MNNKQDIYATISQEDEPAVGLQPDEIVGGKFKLNKQLGRGGMGVVWKAKDLVANRFVALKFVPKELNRFEAEMKRVRESFGKVHALNHQSICLLYSLENDRDLGYYIVMKYLEGEILDEFTSRKDLNRLVA